MYSLTRLFLFIKNPSNNTFNMLPLNSSRIFFPSSNWSHWEGRVTENFMPGNIGIGTIEPRSLLELSNIGGQRLEVPIEPVINFERSHYPFIGYIEQFIVGGSISNPDIFTS